MDSTKQASALTAGVGAYLRSIESGNYRRNVESVLQSWSDWVTSERDINRIEKIEVLDCRHYARHLKQQVREGDLKASTARTYYATVRAFLGFCVDDELIESNPAAVQRAVDELPKNTGDADRQFWGREKRQQFLEYLDTRARTALKADSGLDKVTAYRDRALVYVLAFSGVRSGEVFGDPADEKRTGVQWSDLNLKQGTLRVFGKSREYEYAQIPDSAVTVLDRYKRVLDPATPEWPLFPTNHRPSLYKAVRSQLSERGGGGEEIERLLDEAPVETVIQEHGVVPPPLSKNGARSIVTRLCEAADIKIDGEPLQLHGARRGLGHELYRKGHAELAQSALRHTSIEVTHDSYSDIQASETATQVGDVLDSE
jgi:integrase